MDEESKFQLSWKMLILFRYRFQDSRDNMSIVLVTFPGAPTPDPEAIQREKQLEDIIERRIKSK